MFQTFDQKSRPEAGPPRLALLRAAMAAEGLDGFLVPRADAHMGETVAPCDERLLWLTGFTGSAGLCAALATRAAVFVDGRYTLQVRAEVDLSAFEPVASHETPPAEWLLEAMPEGGTLGHDPWLHGREEIEALAARLAPRRVTLKPCANLVDRIWDDRPPRPAAPVRIHPAALSGEAPGEKRRRIAAALGEAEVAVLTLPESIAWLLDIRGGDIRRTPVAQAFAILQRDGRASLFGAPDAFGPEVRRHLGNEVDIQPRDGFEGALRGLSGRKVAVDRTTAPARVGAILEEAGAEPVWGRDPCILPKARKTEAERAGIRAAHLRDGLALARFLAWLDRAAPAGGLTEIDVVTRLEALRAEAGGLLDIAFDTICGAGPNGAIVHYRVTRATNRTIAPGDLLLVDSGAQYADGTTDVTRTVATGPAGEAERQAFTGVLKGMIAISRLRFPAGLAGRDIDAFARAALWEAGFDYDHGTGHGVGAALGVHEGPQGISRRHVVPFEPGMIVSNEPGFYRSGAFGIRIENLLAVEEPSVPAGGERAMLGFETLTFVPIDRRLILPARLTEAERRWIDAYHAEVAARIGPALPPADAEWLARACQPLDRA